MNILEELWYGNISPIEQSAARTEEYRELLDQCIHNRKKLEAALNAEEKETMVMLDDCWSKLQMYGECGAFVTGFRLAVQLMTASLGAVRG